MIWQIGWRSEVKLPANINSIVFYIPGYITIIFHRSFPQTKTPNLYRQPILLASKNFWSWDSNFANILIIISVSHLDNCLDLPGLWIYVLPDGNCVCVYQICTFSFVTSPTWVSQRDNLFPPRWCIKWGTNFIDLLDMPIIYSYNLGGKRSHIIS